jgi:hypothetical protein
MSIVRLPTLGPAVRGQKAGDTSCMFGISPSMPSHIYQFPLLRFGTLLTTSNSVAVTQSTIWTVAELNVPIMACCLVVLAKPIVSIMSPLLKRIPMFASRFRTTRYADYGAGKSGGSRFQDSKGWQRAEDSATAVTIGGGRMQGDGGFRMGAHKGRNNDLTSDGASDESILGFQKQTYAVDARLDRGNNAIELHNLKPGGIVRTVDVDINVSDRQR